MTVILGKPPPIVLKLLGSRRRYIRTPDIYFVSYKDHTDMAAVERSRSSSSLCVPDLDYHLAPKYKATKHFILIAGWLVKD